MKPPAWMIWSKAARSTTRSFTSGKARARKGSTTMVSPSLKLRRYVWHVAMPWPGPCGLPLIVQEQVPQMPSRQSWANAIGSSPRFVSSSFTTSSISRKDMLEFRFFAG